MSEESTKKLSGFENNIHEKIFEFKLKINFKEIMKDYGYTIIYGFITFLICVMLIAASRSNHVKVQWEDKADEDENKNNKKDPRSPSELYLVLAVITISSIVLFLLTYYSYGEVYDD